MVSTNFPCLGPIVIGTTNIDRALEFYVPVFGLEVKERSENYASTLAKDGTHIELEEDSKNRFPQWKAHNIGTYKNSEFFVKDLSLFLETVTKHGGTIVSALTKRPWGSLGAEIADPEGNIFLITQK